MSQSVLNIFDTVQRVDHLHFWSDSGLQYREVQEFLSLDTNELSKISGVKKSSVRLDNRIPADLKERLEEIANVCNLVAAHFGGDAARTALWFKTPNPVLGGISPRDMIRLGRYKRLFDFIMRAKEHNEGLDRQASLVNTHGAAISP